MANRLKMGQCIRSQPRVPHPLVLGRDVHYPVFRLYHPSEYCPHQIIKRYPMGTKYHIIRPGLIIVDEQEVFLTRVQSQEWGL